MLCGKRMETRLQVGVASRRASEAIVLGKSEKKEYLLTSFAEPGAGNGALSRKRDE